MFRLPLTTPRIIAGFGALFAGTLLAYGLIENLATVQDSILLSGLTFALAFFALRGLSQISALTGKILVFASAISLLALLIKPDELASTHTILFRLIAFVGGLYLERVNLHRRFAPWMFLALATKVEFFLVAAFLARQNEAHTTIPAFAWWLIPASMALAVPLLVLKFQTGYRALVWATSLTALSLAALALPLTTLAGTAILFLVVAWPLIIERVLGMRTLTAT